MELLEDAVHVTFDGRHLDREPAGNLLVGQIVTHEPEDLDLSQREPGIAVLGATPRAERRELAA